MKKLFPIFLAFLFFSTPCLAEIPDSISDLSTQEISEIYPYAHMANQAYESMDKLEKIQDWTPIKSITENGFKVASFRNDKRAELVLSFAGTDSISDFIDDIVQAAGGLNNQYNRGLSSTLAYLLQEAKGQNYQVILTGHSLGGGIAAYVAQVLGLKAYTFNPAPLNEKLLDDTVITEIITSVSPHIFNIVSFDEYDQYDVVASSSGELYGTTKRLTVDTSRFNFIERHSIETILETLAETIAELQITTTSDNSITPYAFDKSKGPEIWALHGNLLFSERWYYSYQNKIEQAQWLVGEKLSIQGKTYLSQSNNYYLGAHHAYYSVPAQAQTIAVWTCRYTGGQAQVQESGTQVVAPESYSASLVNGEFEQAMANAYQPLVENYAASPVIKSLNDTVFYQEVEGDFLCGYLVFGSHSNLTKRTN